MKIKVLLITFFAIFLLFGCSDIGEKDTSKETQKNVKINEKNNQEKKEIKQNKDLTKKITDEKGVIAGQVYEQNGKAVGTLVLDSEVSDKEAKDLAKRYATQIKNEYKNLPVNVQAVKDGKNVADVTIDK